MAREKQRGEALKFSNAMNATNFSLMKNSSTKDTIRKLY